MGLFTLLSGLQTSAWGEESAAPETITVGDCTLNLGTPPWAATGRSWFVLDRRGAAGVYRPAYWSGDWGGSRIDANLMLFSRSGHYLHSPEDLIAKKLGGYRKKFWTDPRFALQSRELVEGAFGCVRVGLVCTGLLPHAAEPTGEVFLLVGLLRTHAYEIEVVVEPPLPKRQREALLDYLRGGLTAAAELRNPRWSEAEVDARLQEAFADDEVRASYRPVLRTEHYIIFSSRRDKENIGRALEEAYHRTQAVLPFADYPWRRLMPVFVCGQSEEFDTFCRRVEGRDDSEPWHDRSHFYGDYVVIDWTVPYAGPRLLTHEAVHQIMFNRLFLTCGGAWFQEGVAEYICSTPFEREQYAQQNVVQGRSRPLTDLMRRLHAAGADVAAARTAYLQAASVFEFLHRDKRFGKGFLQFVHRVGSLPRARRRPRAQGVRNVNMMPGDVDFIEYVVRSVYGVSVDGLQAAWQGYWIERLRK